MTANSNRIMGSRQRASLVTDLRPGPETPGQCADGSSLGRHGRLALAPLRPPGVVSVRILGSGAVGQDGGLAGRRPVPLAPQREEGRRSVARMTLSSNLF